MFDPAHLALAAAIIGVAAFLQGFSGFGINVFAVPFLAHLADVHSVVPMCIFVAGSCTWLLLWLHRDLVRIRPLLPVLVSTALGAPVGVIVLSRMNETWAMRTLGITLLALVVAQALANESIIGAPKPWKAAVAGLLGGMLGGAFAVPGPPIAFYIHVTSEPAVARVSLWLVFGITGIFTLSGHVLAGNATAEVFKTGLMLTPAAMGGGALGGKVARKVQPAPFKLAMLVLLTIIGLVLIAGH